MNVKVNMKAKHIILILQQIIKRIRLGIVWTLAGEK